MRSPAGSRTFRSRPVAQKVAMTRPHAARRLVGSGATAGLCASRENEAVARHVSRLRLEAARPPRSIAAMQADIDHDVDDVQLDGGTNIGALALFRTRWWSAWQLRRMTA